MPEHALAEIGMPSEGGEHVIRHPSLAADNDKARVLGGQPVKGLKQERIVLAGLDRPHRQQVAQAAKFRESRCAGLTLASAGVAGTAKSAPSFMTRVDMERPRKRFATPQRSRATPAEVASA